MSFTVAERRHLGRVSKLDCVVCARIGWETPAQVVHHILGDDGRRVGHGIVLPLCVEHHTGNTGVHGEGDRPEFERRHKCTELDLLNDTVLLLA
jgi:hypothetical protein